MAGRADWEAPTRQQRHLAVAADAELRRRHPEQRFTPLRSAEPQATTDAQRAELTLTAGQDIPQAGPDQGGGARRQVRSGRKAPANGVNTTEIREWAKAQGIEVKDRGRVPAELVVKFKASAG